MRHTYRYLSLINKLFRLNKKLIFHDHYGLIEINQSKYFHFAKYFAPFYYIGVSDKLTAWGMNVFCMKYNRCSTLINLPKKCHFIDVKDPHCFSKKLVIVGNIKPVKNQSFAIDFANMINHQIDIIGKVHDFNYFSSLDTSNVNFNHDVDDVSKILKDYKFGICTSISESGPLVLLEYLINGLPFLSVKSGGIAEVLAHYLPEYFLDGFVMKDWLDRYKILNDNYSRINHETVNLIIAKEFSRDKYLDKLLSIYHLCQ
jgi:glycosyltransferase involved in cell wall biosynthesis